MVTKMIVTNFIVHQIYWPDGIRNSADLNSADRNSMGLHRNSKSGLWNTVVLELRHLEFCCSEIRGIPFIMPELAHLD